MKKGWQDGQSFSKDSRLLAATMKYTHALLHLDGLVCRRSITRRRKRWLMARQNVLNSSTETLERPTNCSRVIRNCCCDPNDARHSFIRSLRFHFTPCYFDRSQKNKKRPSEICELPWNSLCKVIKVHSIWASSSVSRILQWHHTLIA